MLIKLRCSSCFAKVSADDELIGRQVNCPSCNYLFTLPKPQFGFGKILEGYEIEQWLGAGAMGEVYLARQVSMNRAVALKVIRYDLSMDSTVIERFNKEAQILASLNHTSIVPAFDAGHTDECYYMAMGFIDGETLEDIMKRKGVLGELEMLKICRRITEALEYAWDEFSLLHRDIKPANIMIDSMKEVKVMDMGIAKNTMEDSGLTQSGMVIGTPFYMSPEQSQASHSMDFRSDLYALGATMYHLLTGTLPFHGPNLMSILAKKMNAAVVPPDEINPRISPETSALIVKLLNPVADLRVLSFTEMTEALKSAEVAARKFQKNIKRTSTKTIHMAVPDKLREFKESGIVKRSSVKKPKKSKKKIIVASLIGLVLLLIVVLAITRPGGSTVDSPKAKVDEVLFEDFAKSNMIFSWLAFRKGDREKVVESGSANIGLVGEMKLRDGVFALAPKVQANMKRLSGAKEFSIQLNFRTKVFDQDNAVILAIGIKEKANLALVQKGNELFLKFKNKYGIYKLFALMKINEIVNRVTIIFNDNTFTAYKNGELKKTIDSEEMRLGEWDDFSLVLGKSKDGNSWRGAVFSMAVFDGALTEKQISSMIQLFLKDNYRKKFKK